MWEFDSFDQTMRGLEVGLQVQHIATFDPVCCNLSDDIQSILSTVAWAKFSQFPVQRDGHVVGVLERKNGISDGTAQGAMKPLDGSMIVAAETPILAFIHIAAEAEFKLVVDRHQIRGIVARADLLKLPVRVVTFAVLAHLEAALHRLIRGRVEDKDWLAALDGQRECQLRDKFDHLKQQGIEPNDLLSVTTLKDRMTVARERCGMSGLDGGFVREVKCLRNHLAHDDDYVADDDAVIRFADIHRKLNDAIISARERLGGGSQLDRV